jgi:FtsP/CotA-like multicopper oxidase with cupredoxin domain
MSSRVKAIRRMSPAKLSILGFAALALVTTVVLLTAGQGFAITAADQAPHYFGPYPNWANSPLAMPDATVTVDGKYTTQAKAVATVGANGAITAITVTDGGSGYTQANVVIGGSGSGATAKATIVKKGAVVDIQVTAPGSGYTAPTVSFTGGGAGSGAAATAYGSVDPNITISNGGSGYTAPTVDFDLPDGPGGVQARGHATIDGSGTVTAVVVDEPGSGYSTAPGVTVRNGTVFDPIPLNSGGSLASVSATLHISLVNIDAPGSGYTSAPTVVISDPTGTGATAVATLDNGVIASIAVTKPGSGYVTGGGIKKFTDPLKAIPVAVPDTSNPYATGPRDPSDTYEIGLVQYRTNFSSSMPQGALVRGYVQLESASWLAQNPGVSQHVALFNELKDGTKVDTGYFGVTAPQYLGPTIVATKNKPVRIVFRNLLPTGAEGDLFLPVDSTLMGSGMGPLADQTPASDTGSVLDGARNPMCSEPGAAAANPTECFTQNRATLHLHGGITPWISDGTPHQWITPAGENTSYPQGVSVQNVPDMNVCGPSDDGCQTFYYTNEQSARLMFYHDHAWGITRLNVYAGEAAGYLVTDDVEKALTASTGALSGMGVGTPLIIQDKTFVPSPAQLAQQDPTWDSSRWGGQGNLWNHHVYMPAQNPGDPTGMSPFGRWMYGPWFWPPASPAHGPINNPYYDPNCDPNTAAFCEPQLIPGTPNITVGMEQFNDTPVVNGTAYPTTTVSPKAYRFRILNAANDRFWNLQWYVADSTGTEVALKASEVAAAQLDPNVFPTPDTTLSPQGPKFIQIGNEGGFLPAPVVVDNQPITWIIDPTRFDVGNVDKHALLLAPAERADVVVDFSAFRGKTLILYNDAPAAFPARVASYDYYTGGPDLWPVGAPSTLPGYGPNTRTIMQVKVANTAAAKPFSLTALQNAFKHHADGSGVFEKGQDPIIVGQAAYNSAYGTNFVASGWCNAPGATGTAATKCDGFARIQEGSQPTDLFGFNGLKGSFAPGVGKLQIPFQPKGLHDEMNSTSFDEYGRMQASLGLEAPGANPLLQNIILYPYVNPSTELVDATNLPLAPTGLPGDIQVTPISSAADGTQIWKLTHNGVDTHPIHWHLWNVQVINRVTWDNIIIPPDPAELGWKETVRVSPLEDTIVALRPIIPRVPFELPNSARPLNPAMPLGSTVGFNNVDANGNPTGNITNEITNFGWEYVYHCHILSHEEMDMMRPMSVMLPPIAADSLAFNGTVLSWNDNSINETQFVVETSADGGTSWAPLGTPLLQPLVQDVATGHGSRSVDLGVAPYAYTAGNLYRVVAQNVVGYDGAGGAYMQSTVQSVSAQLLAP